MMKLSNLLKTYRQKTGLSQEQAADNIGVNIHTIQNWEYGRLPSLDKIQDIMNTYQIPYDRFKDVFFDNLIENETEVADEKTNEIPVAFFRGDGRKKVKQMQNLVFTEFETELLRNLAVYCPEWLGGLQKKTKQKINGKEELVTTVHEMDSIEIYQRLPYEYAKTIDILDFRKIMNNWRENVFQYDKHLWQAVADYLTGTPYLDYYCTVNPVKNFNMNTVPQEYITTILWDLPYCINWDDFRQIKEIKKGHTCIFHKDLNVEKYIRETRPQRFDCRNYFKDDWYELISCMDSEMYKSENMEYYDTALDSCKRWTYNVFIKNEEPQPFANDWITYTYTKNDEGFIISCTASLTKKGEELWKYVESQQDYINMK